jgi:hypothetical protein
VLHGHLEALRAPIPPAAAAVLGAAVAAAAAVRAAAAAHAAAAAVVAVVAAGVAVAARGRLALARGVRVCVCVSACTRAMLLGSSCGMQLGSDFEWTHSNCRCSQQLQESTTMRQRVPSAVGRDRCLLQVCTHTPSRNFNSNCWCSQHTIIAMHTQQ